MKNSLNMTKEDMDISYPDRYTQEETDAVNHHLHWVHEGYCKICGRAEEETKKVVK